MIIKAISIITIYIIIIKIMNHIITISMIIVTILIRIIFKMI